MEIAQFLNVVIIARGNLYLTHYLGSLGDIAPQLWRNYGHFALSPLRSAGVQLRDSAPFLPEALLPGPSHFPDLCPSAAKSPAHVNLVEKRGYKDNSNLVVLTRKRCVLRAGTEVGKRLSRSLNKQFSRDNWEGKKKASAL
jgi:hypothetical protein